MASCAERCVAWASASCPSSALIALLRWLRILFCSVTLALCDSSASLSCFALAFSCVVSSVILRWFPSRMPFCAVLSSSLLLRSCFRASFSFSSCVSLCLICDCDSASCFCVCSTRLCRGVSRCFFSAGSSLAADASFTLVVSVSRAVLRLVSRDLFSLVIFWSSVSNWATCLLSDSFSLWAPSTTRRRLFSSFSASCFKSLTSSCALKTELWDSCVWLSSEVIPCIVFWAPSRAC
ncbi:hypothetical protein F4803DRAFT_499070 [Xylaria telfairii]|nr:hypothetical protein F4803DRAFT_499070 [Xylaria telfairii]